MRLGHLLPFFVVLFVVFGKPNIPTIAEDGRARDLSPEKVVSLEKELEQNPHELAIRTRLLHYYFGSYAVPDRSVREEMEAAQARHILWLIRNRPEAEVLGLSEGTIDSDYDPEGYSEGKKAWMERLQSEPANLTVLEHAANFFMHQDSDLAIISLQHAQSLDVNNAKWSRELGQMYSLEIIGADSLETKAAAAQKALAQYERAYELLDGNEQNLLLTELARMAVTANQYEKATEYANAMLSVDEDSSNWNSGNRIHHGNLVLGRIALAEGDVEEAKRRLIAAGETTGSPVLISFGPNMMLAKELLQKGEKEVVLEYFRLCSRFWEMGKRRLQEWSVLVQGGLVPDFGGNCSY